MFDICCLGDAMIDFKPVKSVAGEDCVQANAGGTAANLACACARMGLSSAMMGKVGSDQFGTLLLRTFERYGVNTDGVIVGEDARTTLAFITLDENGDRSFSFFRNPGADMLFRADEVNRSVLESSRIFYYSTMALTDEPERGACRMALETAREKGLLICYDVNLRTKLWKDLNAARETIREYIGFADILKLSEEELVFVCGRDEEAGIEQLAEEVLQWCSPQLLVISLGEKGCFYKAGQISGVLPGYRVKSVDTTGAGDAFVGGMLSMLCRKYGADLSCCAEEDLKEILDFANASGALSVTRLGSITALPDLREVELFQQQKKVDCV